MTFLRLFIASLLMSSLPLCALADKNTSARMQKLLMHYDKILEIPESERTHIRPAYRVKARNVDQSEIKAWYEIDGQKYDIEFDARGVIMNLPDVTTYEANPKIYTNQPRKNLVLAMRIRPDIPLTTRMDGADLLKSIAQADEGMGRVTGMWRMFKPTIRGFDVEVLPGTDVTLHLKNGETQTLPLTIINPILSRLFISIETLETVDYVSYTKPPEIMRYSSEKT